MSAAATLILHHYASSPFCEKVRLALGRKSLTWGSDAAGAHEVVVHHTSAEAGDLRLHFPRAGFEVKAA